MNPTLTAPNVVAYLAQHQGHPPEGLTARLLADFGIDDGNGGGDVDEQLVRERLEAIQAECDRDGLRWYDVQPGETKLQVEAFARDIQAGLGRIYAHAQAGLDALKGEAPPVEPPAPPPYDSFGGTWGAEHGQAFDLYPNGEDGPHGGYVFRCPAAGTVTRYSFGPGPLGLQCYMSTGRPPSGPASNEVTAVAVQMLLMPEHVKAITALGTYMHIAVLTFDAPQQTPGGQTVRAIWIGHCRDGFATGRRWQAGDPFCVAGNSGIEFAGVDASHGHLAGTATGTLSPNGDVPGVEVARLLGFRPRVTAVPGPADYAAQRADRGKFR
jgi:hypothetical protein